MGHHMMMPMGMMHNMMHSMPMAMGMGIPMNMGMPMMGIPQGMMGMPQVGSGAALGAIYNMPSNAGNNANNVAGNRR
jgi:hypothetical protein